jgi:hypothetical protein
VKPLTRLLLVALCVSGAAAACSSSVRVRTAPTISSTSTTAGSPSKGATTTSQPLEATVPDCGAGAYRPSTLLIVCSTGGTMATGIQWTAWGTTAASGTGTVHLVVGGSEHAGWANLELSGVSERGNNGPQFSRLTVTWIGPSPDGHPTDSFPLGSG